MKRIYLLFFLLLLALQHTSFAQSWNWAKTSAIASNGITAVSFRNVVAAAPNRLLWGVMQTKQLNFSPSVLGDYSLKELTAAGALIATTTISGTVSLLDAQGDAAGNWYVMGTFNDSVKLSNGMSLYRTSYLDGNRFIARFHAGTPTPDWLVMPCLDYSSTFSCFAVTSAGVYVPIDTNATATLICRYSLATGARSTLWTQDGRSTTTSIQADSAGNVYLTGTGLSFTGALNFNGTPAMPPFQNSYSWYLARYHADGTHHWHYYSTDITGTLRSLKLTGNSGVILSGALSDSATLAGAHFNKPYVSSFFDYLLARFDSSGNLTWAHQRPAGTGAQGLITMQDAYHSAVSDTTFYLFSQTGGTVNWGTNISTTDVNYNATLTAFGLSGAVMWAKTVKAYGSTAQHIMATSGNLYITGNASDTFSVGFDTVTLATPGIGYIPYVVRMKLAGSDTTKSGGNGGGGGGSGVGVQPVVGANSPQIFPNPA